MGCDDDIRKKEIIHNFTKKPGEPEGGNQTIVSSFLNYLIHWDAVSILHYKYFLVKQRGSSRLNAMGHFRVVLCLCLKPSL